MPKKSFPFRLDDARADRLAAMAAKMQVSKSEILTAALDARLDLLEGYVKMDAGPPRLVKDKPVIKHLKPGDDLRSNFSAIRRVRGYDATTGEAIY